MVGENATLSPTSNNNNSHCRPSFFPSVCEPFRAVHVCSQWILSLRRYPCALYPFLHHVPKLLTIGALRTVATHFREMSLLFGSREECGKSTSAIICLRLELEMCSDAKAHLSVFDLLSRHGTHLHRRQHIRQHTKTRTLGFRQCMSVQNEINTLGSFVSVQCNFQTGFLSVVFLEASVWCCQRFFGSQSHRRERN